MHANKGLFEDNGRCGYVLKPDFLRLGMIAMNLRVLIWIVLFLSLLQMFVAYYLYSLYLVQDNFIADDQSFLVFVSCIVVDLSLVSLTLSSGSCN